MPGTILLSADFAAVALAVPAADAVHNKEMISYEQDLNNYCRSMRRGFGLPPVSSGESFEKILSGK